MTELELLHNGTLSVDSGPDKDQSQDEYLSAENMLDPPRIDSIPEGKPSAVEDGLFTIDKDMIESHHSKINQDDATLILSLLDTSKEERTTNRNRHLHVDLENELTKSSEERLRKAEYSHNSSRILKTTESRS